VSSTFEGSSQFGIKSILGYNRSAACTILFNESVVFVDSFKRFGRIPTKPPVVFPNGTVVTVHIFEAFTQTGTGKVICDSKVRDSLDHFFDDGVGFEAMAILFINIIVRQRIGI
jgi:hypothetical protein